MKITFEKLAKMIDHTVLKPTLTRDEFIKHWQEVRKFNFGAISVNPCFTSLAAKLVKETDVKVDTAIGFPLGATTPEVKAFEARNAVENGAHEIDMVINIGALRSGDHELVKRDIEGVVKAAKGRVVKVIIESGFLTDEEKKRACELAKEAGADFVKTSTGFAIGGATIHDVKLMRKIVGEDLGVKAAGGIHHFEDAVAMIDAGADRIGTSASIQIMKELEKESRRG